MSEPNYAGNIIINLASLPDFLREPILAKRLKEFFPMSAEERREVVRNALEAGPDIPFPNFAKLCKTWMGALAAMGEGERLLMFGTYMDEIADMPERIIRFNLDGLLEVFLSLTPEQQGVVGASLVRAVDCLDDAKRRMMYTLIPNNAKKAIGM